MRRRLNPPALGGEVLLHWTQYSHQLQELAFLQPDYPLELICVTYCSALHHTQRGDLQYYLKSHRTHRQTHQHRLCRFFSVRYFLIQVRLYHNLDQYHQDQVWQQIRYTRFRDGYFVHCYPKMGPLKLQRAQGNLGLGRHHHNQTRSPTSHYNSQ
ncbi:hypothetical protein BJX96DRAFT_148758 [Aspergillus floccosus]